MASAAAVRRTAISMAIAGEQSHCGAGHRGTCVATNPHVRPAVARSTGRDRARARRPSMIDHDRDRRRGLEARARAQA
jgi:hypothetical protein